MIFVKSCQDLSLAGKRAGMGVSQAQGGTRSGLLWEVERILGELPLEKRPNVLLLENVPEACGTGNLEHWKKWVARLSELGYQTFSNIINAKDYGIPQNRKRLFAISIKERERELAYQFPRKIKRKYDLEHFLEDNVDSKYFLTEEQYKSIAHWKAQQDPLAHIEEKRAVSPCLTARGSTEMHSGMVLVDEKVYKGTFEYAKGENFIEDDKRFHKDAKESQTLLASGNHNGIVISTNAIPIKNATKQGYLLAEKGDGVDIGGRMKHHRGTVQKGMCQTIKTVADVGVIVNANDPQKKDE